MSKNPWRDCPEIWEDEKAYMQWLRSSIRRVWSKHPIKLQKKKQLRYKAPLGKNGKEVFVIDCQICGKPSRETQTDHISPGGSFSNWEEFCEWSRRILWVSLDDIRELCKKCHDAVTLSQRMGITYEQAVVEKEVIAICKTTASQVEWLESKGITPAKNAKERREQIRKEIKNE